MVADDVVAETLEHVAAAADADAVTSREIAAEARDLAADRRAGRAVAEEGFAVRMRTMVTAMATRVDRLGRATLGLRRAWARGLRAEGLSVRDIGRHFGVTHQRVSALLADRRASSADDTSR